MSRALTAGGHSPRVQFTSKGPRNGAFSIHRHKNVYRDCPRLVGSRHLWTSCLGQPETISDGQQGVSPKDFEELHGESFWSVLGNQPTKQLNVVICYTSKCMPCKQVKPIMAEWEEDLVQGQDRLVKMFQFALTMPNKDCALAMDVRSSPTFLVIRDGEIVCRGKGKGALDEIRDYVYENA